MATTPQNTVEPRDLYVPTLATVTAVRDLTPLEKLFTVELPGGADLGHRPGQFVQVSLFGVGEGPFSISSSPTRRGSFQLGIRRVGTLTEKLHALQPGDRIGIRGPLGNGFDLDAFRGRDVLIIAGGIGLVPLRSLIHYVLDNRDDFGRLIICYGSRSDAELLFTDELKQWAESPDVEYHVTVDRGSPAWQGKTGVITTLIPDLQLDLPHTVAAVCGPPVMYRFVVLALQTKGLPEENMYLSLERRMKCGVGKCGHCQINHSYVCQDGPVYHYPVLKTLQEAL